MREKAWLILYWVNVLFAVLFACWMLTELPVVMVPLSDGNYLEVWKSSAVYGFRWLYYALVPIGLIFHFLLYKRIKTGKHSQKVYILIDLVKWIPVVLLALPFPLLGGTIPIWARSTAIFYIPVFVLSLFIAQAASLIDKKINKKQSVYIGIAILILSSFSFWKIGVHYSDEVGAHVGDEAHYYTIAQSLKLHGTLDLKQIMTDKFLEDNSETLLKEHLKLIRPKIHISRKARNGHWYSSHSIGLPLLLAIADPVSLESRHLVLGIIAGAGCLGLYMLIIALGATHIAKIIIPLFLFTYSMVWGGYAARSLPEVLGASLVCWFAWGIFVQKKYPIISLLVATATCAYIPWAHFRYFPLGLICAAAFVWRGWFDIEKIRTRIIRLVFFVTLVIVGYLGYFVFQGTLFESSSAYNVSGTLLSYPLGAWFSFVDRRGLIYIFPLFMWLLPAMVVVFVKRPAYRFYVLFALLLFAVDVALCCTTPGWTNGSSLPGKKLLIVLPLFLPFAAILWDYCSSVSRWFLIFLGLISVALFTVVSCSLQMTGRGFVYGPECIATSVSPFFEILRPYANYARGTRHTFFLQFISSGWVLVALGLTFVLIMFSEMKKSIQFGILAAISISAVICSVVLCEEQWKPNLGSYRKNVTLRCLKGDDLFLPGVSHEQISGIEQAFSMRPPLVDATTEKLSELREGSLVSQPYIEYNDWDGRDIRWITLVDPFTPVRGRHKIRIKGKLIGNCKAFIAIRYGSSVMVEKMADVDEEGRIDELMQCEFDTGNQHVYLLLDLRDGEGTFIGESISIIPTFRIE